MKKWWIENGWKFRIYLYSILIFPIDLIEEILLFIFECYRNFFRFLLWKLLNRLFVKGEKNERKN